MKTSEIKKKISLFYLDKTTGKPDINNYGKYRCGLTSDEVKDYLAVRAFQSGKTFGERLLKKYHEIAGANTCAVVDGIVLNYRWDVQRFSDALFENKKTYFD